MWEYRRRVRYYETDRMGVVHHSNYLRFLEDARMDWIRDHIINYSEMEKMGIIIPVVSATGNFKSFLRYDDEFAVRVFPVKFTGVIEKKIDLTMDPYEKESSEEKQDDGDGEAAGKRNREAVEMELRGIASELNSDKAVKKVKLPDSLASGEKISWEVEDKSGSNGIAIMAVTVLTAFCIYKKRFSVLEQQRRLQRESVMRQLPEFVNRLVLLLNAGLVLTSAFEKSVEESFVEDSKGDDYFYGKLREIYVLCTTTNASMHVEFRKMAKESGIRELMRVSNIISDNIRKGVELTGKLQAESELLWISRKKSCEEKGRLAETKLTLPLMIFLMVLIIITVAPALMEL